VTSEVQVLAVGLVSAVGVGLLGSGGLHLLRGRSLFWQLVLLVVITALAVLAGSAALAAQGFLTGMGLETVALVSLIAVLVGSGVALAVARTVTRWADGVRVGLRRIGRGSTYTAEGGWPRELHAVATELEDTRRRLDDGRARERQVEQSRRDLISWLAQDLQGPMLRVRSSVEDHPELAQEMARMARIVDDLGELSRLHAGSLHLDPQELAVEEIVSEAVAAGRTSAAAGGRGVSVSGSVEPGLRMRVDPVAMTRVLVHLVDQALSHAPEGGSVRTRARGVDGQVEIVVTDGCASVPLDDRPAAAAHGPEVGPALSLVGGIVEAHHGSLESESVPGRPTARSAARGEGRPGCRYVVRLPPDGLA